MLNLVRKYQTGGDLLDTTAMLANVKNDSRNVRKDGSTTRRGRNELEAIRQIEENQKAGHRYIIDHEANTFKLVDKNGQDVSGGLGHGLSTEEDDFTLFRKAKIRKEISERMGENSNYLIKKVEEKQEEKEAELEVVTSSKAETSSKKEVKSSTKPSPARASISKKSNNSSTSTSTPVENKPVTKTSGEYFHPGNPDAVYSKNGNGEWSIQKKGSNALIPITDPKRIAELENNATTKRPVVPKTEEKPKVEAEVKITPPTPSEPIRVKKKEVKKPEVVKKKKSEIVISDAEAARIEAKMAAQEKKDNQDYLDKQAAEAKKSVEESNKDAEALLKQNKRTGAAASMYNARKKISAQKRAEQEKRKKEDEAIKKDKEEYLNSGSEAEKKAKHERSLKTPAVETMERSKTEIEKEAGKIRTVRTALSRINTMSATDKKRLADANIDMLKILAKKYNVKYEAGGRIPKFAGGNGLTNLPTNIDFTHKKWSPYKQSNYPLTNPGMPNYKKPVGNGLNIPAPKDIDVISKYGTFGENKFKVISPEKQNDYEGFVQDPEQEVVIKPLPKDTTATGDKTNTPAKDYSNAASLALDALGTGIAWKAMQKPVMTVDAPVMKAIQGPVNSVLAQRAAYTDQDKRNAVGYARHNANADPGLDMISQLMERSRKNAAMGEILAKSNAFKLDEQTRVNNETNAAAGQQSYNAAQLIETANKNKEIKYNADTARANALAERATNIAKLKTDLIGGISKTIADQGALRTDARLKLSAQKYEAIKSDYKDAHNQYITVQQYPQYYTPAQREEAKTAYETAKATYDAQSNNDPVAEATNAARPLLGSARSIISKLINR